MKLFCLVLGLQDGKFWIEDSEKKNSIGEIKPSTLICKSLNYILWRLEAILQHKGTKKKLSEFLRRAKKRRGEVWKGAELTSEEFNHFYLRDHVQYSPVCHYMTGKFRRF